MSVSRPGRKMLSGVSRSYTVQSSLVEDVKHPNELAAVGSMRMARMYCPVCGQSMSWSQLRVHKTAHPRPEKLPNMLVLLGLYAIVGIPFLLTGALIALGSFTGGSVGLFIGLSLALGSAVLFPFAFAVRRLSPVGKNETDEKPGMRRPEQDASWAPQSASDWFVLGFWLTVLCGFVTLVPVGVSLTLLTAGTVDSDTFFNKLGAALVLRDVSFGLVAVWFGSATAALYWMYMVSGRSLSCPSCGMFRAVARKTTEGPPRDLGRGTKQRRVEYRYKCRYCAYERSRVGYDTYDPHL